MDKDSLWQHCLCWLDISSTVSGVSEQPRMAYKKTLKMESLNTDIS